MSVAELSVLAMRGVLGGACKVAGVEAAGVLVEGVAGFLSGRLADPSQRPVQALRRSVERSWRAVEVALAGESLTTRLDRAEDRGFREQVRGYLAALEAEFPHQDIAFRRRCLADLRAARKQGLLSQAPPGQAEARAAAVFVGYTEPAQALRAEWEVVERLAERVHRAGYEDLGRLVRVRVAGETSLLAAAVRFFFRQETLADPRLFQGLTAERIDQLGGQLESGFAGLYDALEKKGRRLEAVLESVQEVVVQTHAAVLDVQEELRRQGAESRRQFNDLYQAVLALTARLDLGGRELRPRDTLSIRNDVERQAVKQVAARYRALPESQREQLPALLNAIGKLEVAAGDLRSAQSDFATVARLADSDPARGEAHLNAYQAALEQGRRDEALAQLGRAVWCDPGRFSLFALEKYEPIRILGAGGFGVTFHCRYKATGADVAVKVLTPDGLEREVKTVFQEAGALDSIQHPAIIRLRECDFADPARTRPYLVMEYFDGQTMEEYVKGHGPLSRAAFLAVFLPVAEALEAAHERGVLHRDIKPANLLVRPGTGPSPWQVKVIDFGLALKQSVLADAGPAARSGGTVLGSSIAGTIDYAAPEQMGRFPGLRVGPPADVYGFARTCCYALFGTPHPLRTHWKQIPDSLADLLEACLTDDPRRRLGDFSQVVRGLKALGPPGPARAAPVAAEPVVLEALPVVEPPPRSRPETRLSGRRPRRRRDEEGESDDREEGRASLRKPGLPRWASAILGMLYLGLTLGAGLALDEPGRRARTGIDREAGEVKEKDKFGKGGEAAAEASSELATKLGHGIGMMLGGLCFGFFVGAPCGFIIRSRRGWLFVLVVSLGLGLFMAAYGQGTNKPMTKGGVHVDFLAGTGVGALAAWFIAVPIKFFLWLARAG
jgi:serine/threonine protein kinase